MSRDSYRYALTHRIVELIGDDEIVPVVRFSDIVNQTAVREIMTELGYYFGSVSTGSKYDRPCYIKNTRKIEPNKKIGVILA